MIRLAKVEDAKAICKIYNYYIKKTKITFEEIPLSIEEMEKRLRTILEKFPYFVFEKEGQVVGFAYATQWKTRSAYRYTVEATVYVDKEHIGNRIGLKLYKHLLDDLGARGYHRVVSCIALPNEGSVALHEKFGFKKIAHFNEAGLKFEEWTDVGYWEYRL